MIHTEGLTVTNIRMIDLIDAAMTLDFILDGPPQQVSESLPAKRQTKPAIACLMLDHTIETGLRGSR